MHFFTILPRLLAGCLLAAQAASAGKGGYVSLINGTPYEWKLVHKHDYQMQWRPSESVAPGASAQDYFEFQRGKTDGGADAVYSLVGHPSNASFALQARQNGGKRIEVQYQNGLHSLNNPEGSKINLFFEHDGAVPFILSGDGIDEPFISSNPPVAWMQATLPHIGSKSMREIAMPASHDAGMSEITRYFFGNAHNTQTQSRHIYWQLLNGARYFDIRPVVGNNRWYTNHITYVPNIQLAVGGFGRYIDQIIYDINRFNDKYPGELITLDLSHDMDVDRIWEPLYPRQWQDLYTKLAGITDIMLTTEDLAEDLTTLPLSTFIQPGSKSTVIVRIPNYAPVPGRWLDSREDKVNNSTREHVVHTSNDNEPGAVVSLEDIPHDIPSGELEQTTEVVNSSPPQRQSNSAQWTRGGFFHERRLPRTGSYAESSDFNFVSADQLYKLMLLRPSPQSEPLRSTWTITQSFWHTIDIANMGRSIIAQSAWAHRALFRDLWGALSRDMYPNLIEIDDVWNSHVAALCMAINNHFARGVGSNAASHRARRWEEQRPRVVEVKGGEV